MDINELTRDVSRVVLESVNTSVRKYLAGLEANYKKAREEDRAGRSRASRRGFVGWSESYPLNVTHEATNLSRKCTISIDGAPVQVVVQPGTVNMFDWNGRRRAGATWDLMVRNVGNGRHIDTIESESTSFESLVQRGIIVMLGYAYSESGIEPTVKRRNTNKGV